MCYELEDREIRVYLGSGGIARFVSLLLIGKISLA